MTHMSFVQQAPIFGHGAGSTRDELASAEQSLPPMLAAGVDGFITIDPHSSILATLFEQGIVGLALMLSAVGWAIWSVLGACR
ncbi:MAG: hypothetical protein MK101_00400 [Phycisphaerales bacterium]|nr:hypothetical protein [Phycisphaerales bacterium]